MAKIYSDEWVREMAAEEARKGGLVSSRFGECKTLLDVFEVLDEIMWISPKEEKAEAKPPASSPADLTEKQLREAIKLGTQLAEEAALFQLTMKAKQVAELDRQRPRLVWDRNQIEPRQV